MISFAPNATYTGRPGLCPFLELVLNDSSFPFRELVLPSRTPKGHNADRSAE
jgi:hypothetical protein